MTPARSIPPSGNPLIDQQHAELTHLLARAALAARDPDDFETFRLELNAFRRVLAHHFAVEKIIFSGAGFDAASGHDSAHRRILARLDGIFGPATDVARVQDRLAILEELERVLLDHEMLEDAAYWDAVRAHSSHPTLKWREMMALGIDWVDEHHRRMLDMVNAMSEAARSGDTWRYDRILSQFLDLARRHFAAEERHLEAAGKPPGDHRTDHARMLAEVEGLALTEGHAPHVLVDHYLRYWVIEHILGIDRRDLAP
jgi:hemerythrin